MSDSENFLSRWARRKREAAEETKDAKPPPDTSSPAPAEPERAAEGDKPEREDRQCAEPAEPLFDLASLPPIESITAETDIRAFFAPGVPAELTRAALRRMWVADPAIRDFVGLAENSWDFNMPGAIPGFGPIEMTEELRQAVSRLLTSMPDDGAGGMKPPAAEQTKSSGRSVEVLSEIEPPLRERAGNEPNTAQDDSVNNPPLLPNRDEMLHRGKDEIATRQRAENSEVQQSIARRSRGRALPK